MATTYLEGGNRLHLPKTSAIGLAVLLTGPISWYSSGPYGNDQMAVFRTPANKHIDEAVKFMLFATV